MVDCERRHAASINRRRYVDRRAVYHAVRAAVQDHALDVRQRAEFLQGDVMRMDFAVHAERTDGARNGGVFCGTEVENDNHVLLHR